MASNGRARFTPEIACKRTAMKFKLMVQPASTSDIGRLIVSREGDLGRRYCVQKRLQLVSGAIQDDHLYHAELYSN